MISVITPTFNRREMLREVIDGVGRQTFKDVELIIVDDCSSDGTEQMMREYNGVDWIHYHRNEKNTKDPGLNRHTGYMKAKGDYLVFMDDDDLYIDDAFFEKAMAVYREHPDDDLAMVSANAYMQFVYKNDVRDKRSIGVQGYVDGRDFLLNMGGSHTGKYKKPLSTFTTVFARKALEQADFSNMLMMNDYAIYLRALLYGNVYILEDYIGAYRIHNNNISASITSDFLMRNMEERVWVKEHMTGKVPENEIEAWWENQLQIMLVYYLTGTVPTLDEQKMVFQWASEHSRHTPGYYKAVAVSKAVGFVKRIKKAVKKVVVGHR